MVIDFHAHVFPDSLAARATNLLAEKAELECLTDGTLSGTLEKGREWGVDRFVFQNIATNPRQQCKVNDFAISLRKAGQYAFGSVHPESEDALEELERIKAAGLNGIKLHPEYQNFTVDEERMLPIYKKARSLGLPVLFHSGRDKGFPGSLRCPPAKLAKIVRRLDGLTVIAAHMGGWLEYAGAMRHLAETGVLLDTSFSGGYVYPQLALRMADAFGADRLLFGSDAPWMSVPDSLELIKSMGLSKSEENRVLYENALKILEGK